VNPIRKNQKKAIQGKQRKKISIVSLVRKESMKVKAIKWGSVVDKEVNRARQVGEVWEVTKERFEQLKACADIQVEVVEEISNAKKEVKTKKAVKKSTK
jgi:hypothetical protein